MATRSRMTSLDSNTGGMGWSRSSATLITLGVSEVKIALLDCRLNEGKECTS